MMAVSCLGDKHLLIYSCKNILSSWSAWSKKCLFIKCISKYSGDEGNIWKFKKYRAQTCQIRMTGLTLPYKLRGNHIGTNEKLHLKFSTLKMFLLHLQRPVFLRKQRISEKGYVLGEMLKNTEAFESKACSRVGCSFWFWWNHFQEHRRFKFIKYKLQFQQYGLWADFTTQYGTHTWKETNKALSPTSSFPGISHGCSEVCGRKLGYSSQK